MFILPQSLLAIALLSSTLNVQVKQGTKPVAHQKVELLGVQNGQEKLHLSAMSDSQGHASFQLKADPEINLVVFSIYQGLQYFSNLFSGADIPKETLQLEVYPSTESTKDVSVRDLRFFLTPTKDGVRVEEQIVLENHSKSVVIGSKNPDPNSEFLPEVFRFSLPDSTFGLQFGYGFDEKETRLDGNDVLVSHPLLPGLSRFGLSYGLEKSGSKLPFQQKLSFPIEQISLAATDPRLKFKGQNFISDGKKYYDGQLLSTFSAHLDNAKEISFEILNLPKHLVLAMLIPPLAVIILLILLFGFRDRFSLRTESEPIRKEELLEKLLLLRKMREQNLLTETQYLLRRFQILEELIPYYASKA